MSTPVSGVTFLRGLAQRLDLTGLVWVGAGDGVAAEIFAAGADDVQPLLAAGQQWLADPDTAARTPDVHFAPVRTPEGRLAGVVVAAHDAQRGWTARDDALLAYCVEAQGALDLVAEPHPITADELLVALERDELSLLYQPEYDLSTGRLVAAEALVRWHHPEHGDLGPDEFIPQAERSGAIKPLGEWVISTAVGALGRWRRARPHLDLRLRVNVSPVQMTGSDVCDQVGRALREHDVPGAQLGIELTEQEPPHDLHEVADILRRLKQLGVTSAIDDLATGYSTLSRLRNLPVDMIKIDRSLVAGIDADIRAQSIVTAMIGLALNFGLEVVAEGVGNDREVATLLSLGCTRAQGHFLSRPVTAETMSAMLDNEQSVSCR